MTATLYGITIPGRGGGLALKNTLHHLADVCSQHPFLIPNNERNSFSNNGPQQSPKFTQRVTVNNLTHKIYNAPILSLKTCFDKGLNL